ncbi:MAG: glycoside hydrolase family 3 protein [Frankiales bacterium]|nr:glycoside hydrolase family 3 protein [Frankiales bacterium]
MARLGPGGTAGGPAALTASVLLVVAAVSGCSAAAPDAPPTSATTSRAATPTSSATPTRSAGDGGPALPGDLATAARAAYDSLSDEQRIGQLFMIGIPSSGVTSEQLVALRDLSIGNVILGGNTDDSVDEVGETTAEASAATTYAAVAPFVAVDQEGGSVQRLRGPGFSDMPSALHQGGEGAAQLRRDAARWGRELAAAGINLDLAPVADTVPSAHARDNAPIGRYGREFGHTPAEVATSVVAFVRGMSAAKVGTTLKHFPGLGRASGNTDTDSGVTDPTRADDEHLGPFRAGIRAGAPFVMVSSATYPAIDPGHRACFSSKVMRSLLRGTLRFGGVIVSDSMDARALDGVSPGQRAVRFLAAGGTMLLDVSGADLRAMVSAVTDRARTDPRFAGVVEAAVLRVLAAKSAAGLTA